MKIQNQARMKKTFWVCETNSPPNEKQLPSGNQTQQWNIPQKSRFIAGKLTYK